MEKWRNFLEYKERTKKIEEFYKIQGNFLFYKKNERKKIIIK